MDVNRNTKPPQGRKIRKIDPDDLTKVITVYDSIMYLLRSPENSQVKKFNILEAIQYDRVYNGYRWNFVEEGEDPNEANAKPTNEPKRPNKADVLLQLNETKSKILKSFLTQIQLFTELKITKQKLKKIIDNGTQYNGCYYIRCRDCPESLLKDFDGPTTRTIRTNKHSYPIKQINPITKEEVIFNTFDEISVKLGFKSVTIRRSIDNDRMYAGSIWKYCKPENEESEHDEEDDEDDDKESEYDEEDEMENEQIKEKKAHNPNNDFIVNIDRNTQRPQGKKIRKIDPENLENIITVYESMMYLLRSPGNDRLKRHGILEAIEKNTVYEGYRWNFVEKDEDPNIANAKPTSETKRKYKADVILQLNETKTKILKSFLTKVQLCTELKISKKPLNNIIEKGTKYNGRYYVLCRDCPEELLKKFDGPTVRTIRISKNMHPIKQINPITKEEVIFNTLEEISVKLGFNAASIQKAIKNETMHGGSIWKFVNEEANEDCEGSEDES